jgi:lipopolysaccharide export system protein LptC
MAPSATDFHTARQRSARPGSGFDRWMTVLKVALPVAATALGLTFLLLPLTASEEFSFLLSKDQVGSARERLLVERAVYRGEDSRGQRFMISAARAVQRNSATPVVELSGISAELAAKDGPSRAVANAGQYDMKRERITMIGPVRFSAADGTRLETRDVTIDLASRTVTSGGMVDGRVPLGAFRAGRLRADVRGRVVTLDGGASLHIARRTGR